MPDLVIAVDADYRCHNDRVLEVSIRSRARACPIRILNHHEIVNDVVGGEPLSAIILDWFAW